ncbi:MFS transporter [Aquella oligotrophica]|uniref:Major facilitator superfamily (MFS) profile domain-containing protein n=1 Tax=Aquella oligotrophica TaxID=2067065 RepID=A0A2I7N745_9NEIS|nr:MFS transporter [Aquella oligotrophica]AUR52293.1 hypothetical protein CUN60_08285 [Aquella oligotrophica]
MFKKILIQNGLTRDMGDFIKSSFGNIIEWYDFTIYGLFALQIAKSFFPNDNRLISLILIFATFAIGFLARPLGSLIFGILGDNYGKSYAVNLSIWLMAIPTMLIGVLPSYQQIGILAPVLLVVLRICQGISAGGQFSGLITIAVEKYSSNRSLLVSLVYSISVIGCFAASLIGYLSITIINLFTPESLFIKSLIWRVPFVLSIVLFYFYHKMVPHIEKELVAEKISFKFTDIMKEQPSRFFCMLVLSLSTGMIYYTLFTYLVTYMQLHAGLSKQMAFFVMNGILAISVILYPTFGYLANNSINRVQVAQRYCLCLLVAGVLFNLHVLNPYYGLMSIVLMVIFFCAVTSYTTSYFAEVFAKKYRMTACSLSFNGGMSIAGCAPLLAELFSSQSRFGLSYFIVIISCFMFATLLALRKIMKPRIVLVSHNAK